MFNNNINQSLHESQINGDNQGNCKHIMLNNSYKIISIFDTYLDVLLTKYFYFYAEAPYHQKIYDSNKIAASKISNKYSGDECLDECLKDDEYDSIYDEIDEEPYDNGDRCCLCDDHNISLVNICNCKNMKHCIRCFRKKIFIELCNTFDYDSITGIKECNLNIKQACDVNLLLNPHTGKICDIRMIEFIKNIVNIYCKHCGSFNIKYPNANEAIKYKDLLARLVQVNYYQNEHWDEGSNVVHDLLHDQKQWGLPSNISPMAYNNMSFRYYTLLDRPYDDNHEAEKVKLIYYIDPDCKTGTNLDSPMST